MSDNNLVTKSDLGEFYGKILPYLNGNAMSYSTSEQDTGKRWIDGKKIYQKTFTGTITISGGGASITKAMGISNFGDLIDIRGIAGYKNSNTDYGFMSIPQAFTDTFRAVFALNKYSGNITITVSGDSNSALNNQSYKITIWYTKTT